METFEALGFNQPALGRPGHLCFNAENKEYKPMMKNFIYTKFYIYRGNMPWIWWHI